MEAFESLEKGINGRRTPLVDNFRLRCYMYAIAQPDSQVQPRDQESLTLSQIFRLVSLQED